MRVCIHRGAHQIGGNCIEIATNSTRLVIDVGQPLEALEAPLAGRRKPVSDPVVDAVFAGAPAVDGILLSHAHGDHGGLLNQSPRSVPVWMSRGTSKMLMAGSLFAGQSALDQERQRTLVPLEPFQIGDMTITGYPVDHSAFGAMAFLVEAGGRRVLYSGDLRLHGRKPGMVRRIVDDLAGRVDVLLMEGTHMDASRKSGPTEQELEDEILADINTAPGLVLACFSPSHVDRLVTFLKATQRSGRLFAVDQYTAFILHMVSGEAREIPRASAEGIRVFTPARQKRIAKVAKGYVANEIPLDDILRMPDRYVMIFRPSMLGRDFSGGLPRGVRCLYSYWSGYLTKPDFQALQTTVGKVGGDFLVRHTSGHMFAAGITVFIDELRPGMIVPVHTEHPEAFLGRFPQARLLSDGEVLELYDA